MNRRITVLLLAFASFAAGQPTQTDVQAITKLLEEGTRESSESAVEQIGRYLQASPLPAAQMLRSSWINQLIAAKLYPDADRLAIAAMLEFAGETPQVEELQKLRIKAHLAAGKPEEALVAAKALFCVASMSGTRAAVLQVAECLSAASPVDSSRVNQFRREQLAGAAATAASQPAASSILASIADSPATFAAGVERYDTRRYVIQTNPYRKLVALGNLLLLSGKPDEAKAAFEQAREIAPPDMTIQAAENIARAIKAKTLTIGPANDWLGTNAN